MSWAWYVYTAKSAAEVIAFDGELAEASPAGPPPPKPEEVVAYRARFEEVVPAAILERVAACRSTYEFDHVSGAPEDSPLQVSVLRTCLEALAPCVVDWGDFDLELGEEALRKLGKMKSRGRLVATPPPAKRPVKRRGDKPGEVRALRLLELMDDAAEDPEAAVDMRKAIAALSAAIAEIDSALLSDRA